MSEENLENSPHNLAEHPAAATAEAAQLWQSDLSATAAGAAVSVKPARPVWLSTASYLLVAAALSVSFFFIAWGLLHDSRDERETSWIPAGIAAVIVMFIAVLAREVVLRRMQTQYLLHQDSFDAPPVLRSAKPNSKIKVVADKFTLEQNAAALSLIQRKSDEANSSVATAEKHLEVFKACQEYLEIAESELAKVHLSSPRLPALKNGLEGVRILHKHHLLQWAQEETRRIVREAAARLTLEEKLETANKNIETLNFALQFYPQEGQFLESLAAVREFIQTLRIADWIENAERAAFKGNYSQAIDFYQDALFYLQREQMLANFVHDSTAEKLQQEIEKLQSLSLADSSKQKSPRKRFFNRR